MALPVVDIKVIGDKQLERKLARLEGKEQRKVVRQALRKHAKEVVKPRVVAAIPVSEGAPRPERAGHYRDMILKSKIRAAGKRDLIRIGFTFPTREELGIEPGAKDFWPAALEYGHGNVAARPVFRTAVDNHIDEDVKKIGRDIGAGIVKIAKRDT